jgi:hypothetical protein
MTGPLGASRLLIFAAMGIAIAVLVWNLIPPDRPLPLVSSPARATLQVSEYRRREPHSNSREPMKAATVFVALAAQLRGGDHAQLDVDGEDGWTFHEAHLHHLDPRQVPAGVPLFVRITYSGRTWGERAEARTFKCGSILTFAVGRRYNLWCGERGDVVMTLLEETRQRPAE